jgi:uncharacterized pyridoxamine 5'-phosphate oxidase family protein
MFISKDDILNTLKLIQAIPGMPNPVTETEVNNILESKLNMQISTIDEEGYPMIQPTWFLYDDKESGKIYTATQKMTKKVQNIRRNPDKIYFSIDDDNFPYKGVKGRAVAIVEKINMKYLGTIEHPLAKMIMENTKSGTEVVIEFTPKFFSAWDFGKAM